MKRKVLISILALFLVFAIAGCGGSGSGDTSGDTGEREVYKDMKEAFESTDLITSNIGIFSKTESDGS